MNSITIEELVSKLKRISVTTTGNMDDFEPYGVRMSDIEEMNKKAEQLLNFAQDTIFLSEINRTVVGKKKIREKILFAIRSLKLHLKFRETKPEESIDKVVKGIATASDSKTLEKAQAAVGISESWPLELRTSNQIMELSRSLRTLTDQYKIMLDQNTKLKTDRKNLTTDRNKLKNDVYKDISRISELGKWLYKADKPELYKEYILFPEQRKNTAKSDA